MDGRGGVPQPQILATFQPSPWVFKPLNRVRRAHALAVESWFHTFDGSPNPTPPRTMIIPWIYRLLCIPSGCLGFHKTNCIWYRLARNGPFQHQSELVVEFQPLWKICERQNGWKSSPNRDEQNISLKPPIDHQSELGFEIVVGGVLLLRCCPPPQKKSVPLGKKMGPFFLPGKKTTSWGIKTRASSFESPQVSVDRITISKMPKSTGIHVQMVLTMQA